MFLQILDTTLRDGAQGAGVERQDKNPKLPTGDIEIRVDQVEIEIGRASCRERVFRAV